MTPAETETAKRGGERERASASKGDDASEFSGPGGTLGVRWFSQWHGSLDDALSVLPEPDTCPHELLKLLMQNSGPSRKAIALVMDHGEPVAVIGLRQRKSFWEPIAQGVCASAEPPAQEGYLFPALAALRKDIRFIEWPSPPPVSRALWQPMWPRSMPVHIVDLTIDFEEHWRRQRNFYSKSIKRARQRCDRFRLTVNSPLSIEWTFDGWARRWEGDDRGEAALASDRRVAAQYFAERGQYRTFLLLDGDKPIAGETNHVVGNRLVGDCMVFDRSYAWHMVGTHLLDRAFHRAAEMGYEELHLGCGWGYKRRLAPAVDEAWFFDICPPHLQLIKGQGYRIKKALASLKYRLLSKPDGADED